jgi:Na+-transporting NADH:ubiquinone oxidoreductase subunit NqrF
MYLFYGARSLQDLYDHDYFTEIAAAHTEFHYFPALSDPEPDWNGAMGFIHTVLDNELKTGIHGEAYLCGPPIMIDAVMTVLESKGITKESILYDKF